MTKQEKKRIDRDFLWLGKNMPKLQEKYSGRIVAVVNKHISPGSTALEAYNKSKVRFPKNEPLMAAIPTKECLLL